MQIHCYFLLIKCENPLHCKIHLFFFWIKCENPLHSHILSTKNNKYTVIFCFINKKQCICNIHCLNFNESLANDVVNFEQLGPMRSLISTDVGVDR